MQAVNTALQSSHPWIPLPDSPGRDTYNKRYRYGTTSLSRCMIIALYQPMARHALVGRLFRMQ